MTTAPSSLTKMSQLPHIVFLITLLPTLIHAQTGGNLSNCRGGCELGEYCIGQPFSQPVEDAECNTCAGGRQYWPCNFETLCYCSSIEEGAPRVPPAPKSKLKINEDIDPCRDVLTEDVFNAIVQPKNDGGVALYTYGGLCKAISQYNTHHDEKFAMMGSEEQIRAELAAFLAHVAVDTNGFSLLREEFHCVDPIEMNGKVYCKPCKEEHYNSQTKTCSQSYFASEGSYKEYCDVTRQPPQGCGCDPDSVMHVPSAGSGYMDAAAAYFTRGSIHISWNYDYYGASQSLTGSPDLLCDNPDLVATDPMFAWGVGIYKWMEKMTFGTQGSTAHKQALKGNFGGTVEVLYPELECPSNQWASSTHVQKVHDRVAQICKSGSALGVYLEMDKCDNPKDCLECKGLKEVFDACQEDGTCPDCPAWIEFVRSVAPTVTPIRVESPTWDDWSNNYQARSSAVVRAPTTFWPAMFLFLALVSSAGSLFAAI